MKISPAFVTDFRQAIASKELIVKALERAVQVVEQGDDERAQHILQRLLPRGVLAPVEYSLDKQGSPSEQEEFLRTLAQVEGGQELAEFARELGQFVSLSPIISTMKLRADGFENYPTAVGSTPYLLASKSGPVPAMRVDIRSSDRIILTFSADADQLLGLVGMLIQHCARSLEDWRGLEIKMGPVISERVMVRGKSIVAHLRSMCETMGIQFEDLLTTQQEEQAAKDRETES